MQILASAILLMLATPALAGEIEILDPYARTAHPGAPTGAVYMTLRNNGDQADRLIGAESPVAEVVQLHSHIEEDGVMKMRRIEDGIALEPGMEHQMKRGGDHIMLMGVTGAHSDGGTMPLTLVFERTGQISLDVPIDSARGQAGKGKP